MILQCIFIEIHVINFPNFLSIYQTNFGRSCNGFEGFGRSHQFSQMDFQTHDFCKNLIQFRADAQSKFLEGR